MDTSASRKQLEALADEIMGLSLVISRARARAQKGSNVETLTETENLTLDLIKDGEVKTVGEIQQAIGVLPAQMSRIIRALEDKGGNPYITCSINPDDRRKIDVSITKDGRKAREGYRAARLQSIMNILSVLDHDEREEFMRLLRKIQADLSQSLARRS